IQKVLKSKLVEQRIILDRNREKELARKDNKHKREIEKMQAQLKDMGRRLEKKTATELGETPEIDLFETLREEYPDDNIVRMKRGEAGADIHQTVMHRHQSCG